MALSLPPLKLLTLFAIITLLLFLSSYPRYKYEVEKTTTNLKLFLLFLPVLFVILIVSLQFVHRVIFRSSYSVRAKQAGSLFGQGHFPWGVLLMLVLILVLVSKQSYFHSLCYLNVTTRERRTYIRSLRVILLLISLYSANSSSPGREEDKKAGPCSFISFGAGRHECLGASFANMQIKAIWSHLLRNFELELVSPFPEIAWKIV